MTYSEFIHKHWKLLLFLLFCPIGINYIVLCPEILPITGDSDLWLSFFGSFYGSAIMAGITLYVLQEQLRQNHDENIQNRKENKAENASNRNLTITFHLQEIELKWFEDLKLACVKLDTAFNNTDVTLVRDMNPFSEQFITRVAQLITRMNEAYFNFSLIINYHRHIANRDRIKELERYVSEYLSLLSDMNALFVYGQILKELLDNIDLSPEEVDTKLKSFIQHHKEKMELKEITDNTPVRDKN